MLGGDHSDQPSTIILCGFSDLNKSIPLVGVAVLSISLSFHLNPPGRLLMLYNILPKHDTLNFMDLHLSLPSLKVLFKGVW